MQKTNFKTRLLALLTAVFMVIVSMPFAAFAANEGGTDVIPNELSVSFNCWDDGVKVVSKGADNSGDHYATYVLNSMSEQKSLPTLENVPENKEFDGWYINETDVKVVDTRFNFNFLKDYAQKDSAQNCSVTINARFKDKVVEPETKTVKFCFQLDSSKGTFTDKKIAGYASTIVEYTVGGEDETISIPAVKANDEYTFKGWAADDNEYVMDAGTTSYNLSGRDFSDLEDGAVIMLYANFEKKATEPVEPATKTVKFCFQLDSAKGTFADEKIAGYASTIVEYTVGGESETISIPAVNAKDGYTFKGWAADANEYVMDAGVTSFNLNGRDFSKLDDGAVIMLFANFEKKATEPEQPEEPEVKKTVSVTITTNNEQGIFPDYDGQEVIHFDNLDPDTDQQFELPKVEAKPGYEFIGWHVNGNEVGAWDADTKTFGITGLAHFEKGSKVGYLTIAAVYKAETERTVEVTFSVDPDKGEFEKNDLYTSPAANVMKLTATEFDGTQYAIPTVKAKAGYKFVGWKGQGADVIAWNADAKTFGVTGLCFFNGDDATTGYATVEAVFEKIEDKKNDNSSSSSSASSSSNKTTTASNEKQVVKAAAAPANTTKVLPKTGASNVAPLLGGSLAVVALLMGYGVYSLVLRKKD